MSRDGSTTITVWDGEYKFRLAYKHLMELQEACGNTGAPVIAERLRTNSWFVQDIRETIRIALIGGGMTQSEALSKVKKYVEPAFQENMQLAWAIVRAGIEGPEDDKLLGKMAGVRKTKDRTSRMDKSPSPDSMPAASP